MGVVAGARSGVSNRRAVTRAPSTFHRRTTSRVRRSLATVDSPRLGASEQRSRGVTERRVGVRGQAVRVVREPHLARRKRLSPRRGTADRWVRLGRWHCHARLVRRPPAALSADPVRSSISEREVTAAGTGVRAAGGGGSDVAHPHVALEPRLTPSDQLIVRQTRVVVRTPVRAGHPPSR